MSEFVWSFEDHHRSIQEGWQFKNGYVKPYFNSQGQSPFSNGTYVLLHLHEKARTSEWHKALYMVLPWTPADGLIASRLGWNLSKMTHKSAFITGSNTNYERCLAAEYPVAQKAAITLAKIRFLNATY
jgi:hypothetical protein